MNNNLDDKNNNMASYNKPNDVKTVNQTQKKIGDNVADKMLGVPGAGKIARTANKTNLFNKHDLVTKGLQKKGSNFLPENSGLKNTTNQFNGNKNDNDNIRQKVNHGKSQSRNNSLFSSMNLNNNLNQEDSDEDEKINQEKQKTNKSSIVKSGIAKKIIPGGFLGSLVGKTIDKSGSADDVKKQAVTIATSLVRAKMTIILFPILAVVLLLIILIGAIGAAREEHDIISKGIDSGIISPDKLGEALGGPNETGEKVESEIDMTNDDTIKESLINYLVQNNYCNNKDNCEEQDAYIFNFQFIKTVQECKKNKQNIDVGLLYQTMFYYRANEELYAGSTKKTTNTDSLFFQIWMVLSSLFKTKLDETDKLAEKMYNKDTNSIDLNQYVAYLMYGESAKKIDSEGNGSASSGKIDTSGVKKRKGKAYDGSWFKSDGSKGAQVVQEAIKYLGNPYVYGGNSLTNGIDCSAFTKAIFAKFGKQLPRVSTDQINVGKRVNSLKEAKPGDLIVYQHHHVAIYMGDNCIVHASNHKSGIKIGYNASYSPIAGIRRVVE